MLKKLSDDGKFRSLPLKVVIALQQPFIVLLLEPRVQQLTCQLHPIDSE